MLVSLPQRSLELRGHDCESHPASSSGTSPTEDGLLLTPISTSPESVDMVRTFTIRFTALALANGLLLVAALVFAVGFFPFKPLLPGLAAFGDVQEQDVWDDQQPEAIFDRVVFMVVDALRADFVYGHHSGFAFTQEYGMMLNC